MEEFWGLLLFVGICMGLYWFIHNYSEPENHSKDKPNQFERRTDPEQKATITAESDRGQSVQSSTSETSTDEKMTKSNAIVLLILSEFEINENNVTFASKNRSAYVYWSNPSIDVLEEDWSLILNAKERGKLYLFTIPANALSPFDVVVRSDKSDRIDLQIEYNDPSFTDNRSGLRFVPFLVGEVDY